MLLVCLESEGTGVETGVEKRTWMPSEANFTSTLYVSDARFRSCSTRIYVLCTCATEMRSGVGLLTVHVPHAALLDGEQAVTVTHDTV